MDNTLKNSTHKAEVKKQRLMNSHSCFVKYDNIYISENTDSNVQDEDNVGGDRLVEIMHIKQEPRDHQEQIAELEERNDAEPAAATSDITVKTENCDLETMESYPENSGMDLDNSCVDNDLKLENRLDANATGSDFNIKGTSSIIANMHLKSEFQSDKAEFSMENSTSGNKAMDFMNERTDSMTDPLDSVGNQEFDKKNEPKPILLIKRIPGTDSNPCSQVYQVICKDFCASKRDQSDERISELLHKCKRVKTSNTLRQQAVSHNTLRPHQCNMCGEELATLDHLKQHKISKHTVKPHQCTICEKVFNTVLKLRDHMISHGSDRPYNCNKCQAGFKAMYELRNHMAIHDRKDKMGHTTLESYQCNLCEKEFKTKHGLKGHMLIHSNCFPYQCNLCTKSFKAPSHLKKHMVIHSSERPHQCEVCERTFKRKRNLTSHMTSHSTEQPHKCNLCNKGFKTMDTLRGHMIIHSTEQPHQCNLCDTKFKRLKALKRHRAREHWEATSV